MKKICTACNSVNKGRILTATDPETLTLVKYRVCAKCLRSIFLIPYHEDVGKSTEKEHVDIVEPEKKDKPACKPKKKIERRIEKKLKKDQAKWLDMLGMTKYAFGSAAEASDYYADSIRAGYSAKDYQSYILAWEDAVLEELYVASGLEWFGISLEEALKLGSKETLEDGMRKRGTKEWDI